MTPSAMFKAVLLVLATMVGSGLLVPATAAAEPVDTFYHCGDRGSFHNLPYCPVTAAQVRTKAIEPGRRVVVRRVIVDSVSGSEVVLVHPKINGCDDTGCYFSPEAVANVVWPGYKSPATGDIFDLYAITMADRSLTPVGFVSKGNCPEGLWGECFGF